MVGQLLYYRKGTMRHIMSHFSLHFLRELSNEDLRQEVSLSLLSAQDFYAGDLTYSNGDTLWIRNGKLGSVLFDFKRQCLNQMSQRLLEKKYELRIIRLDAHVEEEEKPETDYLSESSSGTVNEQDVLESEVHLGTVSGHEVQKTGESQKTEPQEASEKKDALDTDERKEARDSDWEVRKGNGGNQKATFVDESIPFSSDTESPAQESTASGGHQKSLDEESMQKTPVGKEESGKRHLLNKKSPRSPQVLRKSVYQAFFGLRRAPFNNVPDPAFFFPSPKHLEALARMEYAIEERRGFIVITGEIGSGKTLLCRRLLDSLEGNVKTAVVTNTRVEADQLLRLIAEEFDIRTEGLDKVQVMLKLQDFLIEQVPYNTTVVLIIDEAQNLPADALEEVRMISNLETNEEKLIQIIMLGQPELREKINDPGLQQLRQRINLRFHLEPLKREETEKYIQHRLHTAGCQSKLHFQRRALDRVFRDSGGIPRLINLICDNALLSAYSAGRYAIDDKMIREVVEDLDLSGIRQNVEGAGDKRRGIWSFLFGK